MLCGGSKLPYDGVAEDKVMWYYPERSLKEIYQSEYVDVCNVHPEYFFSFVMCTLFIISFYPLSEHWLEYALPIWTAIVSFYTLNSSLMYYVCISCFCRSSRWSWREARLLFRWKPRLSTVSRMIYMCCCIICEVWAFLWFYGEYSPLLVLIFLFFSTGKLMLLCWRMNPPSRPTFSHIETELLKDPPEASS